MKTIIIKTHVELNALVAGEYMGWTHVEVTGIAHGNPPQQCPNTPQFQHHHPVPNYSRSISYAWSVVEKMAELFQVPSVGSETNGWVCQIVVHGKGLICGNAPTAPIAICLCALAYVGIEVELQLEEAA